MSASGADADTVRLDAPAVSEQLRLVRLLVASVATAHGADMDDLEDLRIATGELCAALVDRDDSSNRLLVEVAAASIDGETVIRLRVRNDGVAAPVALDELSAMVLDTTADSCGTGRPPWSDDDAPDSGAAWMQRSLRGIGASSSARADG